MRCDAKEIPSPYEPENLGKRVELRDVLNAGKDESWWFAVGGFYGQVRETGGEATQGLSTSEIAPIALAIVKHRILGILGPEDTSAPAVWWSWCSAGVEVRTEGSQGMLKKRPEKIELLAHGCNVLLVGVSKFLRSSRQYRAAQENGFLKALESSTAVPA
jgi:hypothetical protein